MTTLFERAAREHISSRKSAGTRELYTADLARWLLHCELSTVNPDEPTLAAAVAFRDAITDKVGPQTVRRILSALSSMYDAAGIINHFKSSKRLPRPEADDAMVTQEFSKEQAEAILQVARDAPGDVAVRDYAILRLLYDVGMRISSAVELRRSEVIKRPDGSVVVITKVKKKGKVQMVLPASAAEALDQWLKIAPESLWVFPADRNRSYMPRRSFNRRLLMYGEKAGVKDAAPHRFRATFISDALDILPLHEVQAAVHHADPKTTLRYDRHKRGMGVVSAVSDARNKKYDIKSLFKEVFEGDNRYYSSPAAIRALLLAFDSGDLTMQQVQLPEPSTDGKFLSLFTGKSAHQRKCSAVALWLTQQGKEWWSDAHHCGSAGGVADVVAHDLSVFAEIGHTTADKILACVRARQPVMLVPYGQHCGFLFTGDAPLTDEERQIRERERAAVKDL